VRCIGDAVFAGRTEGSTGQKNTQAGKAWVLADIKAS